MRAIIHPKKDDFDLHRILHALSDPVRLSMVCRLAQAGDDLTCGALNAGRPKSSMSFHFSTLRSAGLLWTHIEGSIHLNTLRKGEVDERFPGLLDAVLAAPKRNGRRQRVPRKVKAAEVPARGGLVKSAALVGLAGQLVRPGRSRAARRQISVAIRS